MRWYQQTSSIKYVVNVTSGHIKGEWVVCYVIDF